jgi:hypothetical protein
VAGVPRRRLGSCQILRGPIWKVLPLANNEIPRPARKSFVLSDRI